MCRTVSRQAKRGGRREVKLREDVMELPGNRTMVRWWIAAVLVALFALLAVHYVLRIV